MSQGEGYPEPGLPTTHYFVSLSRGDAIRTVMLRPAGLWALAGLAALLFVWSATAAGYLAFHDDLMGAMVARQAAMERAYENRLAETRAQLDAVAGQRALDLKSFASKLGELASRQARLEKRGAVVAALAESEGHNLSAREGRPAQASPADALGAIRALGPPLPAEGDAGSARAYAPLPAPAASPGRSNRIRSMSPAKPWARSPERRRRRHRARLRPTIPTPRRASPSSTVRSSASIAAR